MTLSKIVLAVAVVCAVCVPSGWATTVFSNDSGTADDSGMTNWQTSQMMWLNAFSTGAQTMAISQMSVAFANDLPQYRPGNTYVALDPHLTAGTTVYMGLYADGISQGGNPADAVKLYETSFVYSGTSDSSTFLAVSVPNIPVTGKFFVGVTALARQAVTNPGYLEDAPSLTYAGDASKSWVAFRAQGDTSDINRDTLSDNANVWPYSTWMLAGSNMIRAEGSPVPEPVTMSTLFMAIGGLGTCVRRRAKREA